MKDLEKQLASLPAAPGVYIMKDAEFLGDYDPNSLGSLRDCVAKLERRLGRLLMRYVDLKHSGEKQGGGNDGS